MRPAAQRPAPHEIEELLNTRRRALTSLMHSAAFAVGDLSPAVRQITETAAQALEVERASVWRLAEAGTVLECLDLYERGPSRHSSGLKLRASETPAYFAALREERTIRADDARTDPRTREFRGGYLEPFDITAMLDAPIFVRGELTGVVCHEHTRTARSWNIVEELLAGTFADFVALVLETSARREIEAALETKVDERTRELQASEASFRSLIDLSPVPIVITRLSDDTILFANRRALEMFELPRGEAIARYHAPDFWAARDARQRFLEAFRVEGRVDEHEAQLRTRSGRLFWAHLSAQRVHFGGEAALLAAIVDVTARKDSEERLREQATRDPLTGAFNRRYVEDAVQAELERARRHARPLTIAMIDADRFKNVNDTHGHPVGDQVLRTLSERFRRALRANDVLARYGGEEFLIVFPETDLEKASLVAERLRAGVADEPIRVDERVVRVTVSIGLATYRTGLDPQALLRDADAALYAAKQSGRNAVRAASVP